MQLSSTCRELFFGYELDSKRGTSPFVHSSRLTNANSFHASTVICRHFAMAMFWRQCHQHGVGFVLDIYMQSICGPVSSGKGGNRALYKRVNTDNSTGTGSLHTEARTRSHKCSMRHFVRTAAQALLLQLSIFTQSESARVRCVQGRLL